MYVALTERPSISSSNVTTSAGPQPEVTNTTHRVADVAVNILPQVPAEARQGDLCDSCCCRFMTDLSQGMVALAGIAYIVYFVVLMGIELSKI